MSVYELIQFLSKYPANTKVYFTAEGRIADYDGNRKEQFKGLVPDEDDYMTVEGVTNTVRDWNGHPDILCEICY